MRRFGCCYPGEGGLACVSLSPHRPEVAVQPGLDLADHLDAGWHVPGAIEDHVLLVLGRRSEQLEHRHLRRLDRIVKVVLPYEEQDRHFDPREEIERFNFGLANHWKQPAGQENRRFETRLESDSRDGVISAHAETVV